jgi:thiol:disulfide interchange protein DsbC
MTKGALTEQTKPCDAPLERNLQLAQRFNIRGTPAIYLASGQQIGGYVPAAQIEQALGKR